MEVRQKYRGVGRFKVPEPWYQSTTGEPWHEGKVNWLTDNKYCRLIIAALAEGPKTKKELEKIYVTLAPRLAARKERVKIFMSPAALQNHLDNFAWYGLISKDKGKYRLNLPFLPLEEANALDPVSEKLALKLAEAIWQNREEIAGAASDSMTFQKLIDPLLQRIAEQTLEKLEQQGKISYQWEVFHRWIEEFDIERFRSWAQKLMKK